MLGLGDHPADGVHDDALGEGFPPPVRGDLLETADVARVLAVDLLLPFVASEDDVLGVYNDNVVAIVNVLLVRGLVLPLEDGGEVRCEPPDRLHVVEEKRCGVRGGVRGTRPAWQGREGHERGLRKSIERVIQIRGIPLRTCPRAS